MFFIFLFTLFFSLFQFYDYMQLGHCFKSFFVKRDPLSKINDITIYIFPPLSSGFEESVIYPRNQQLRLLHQASQVIQECVPELLQRSPLGVNGQCI